MKHAAIYIKDPVTGEESFLSPVSTESSIGKSNTVDIYVNDLRCNGIHALIEHNAEEGSFTVLDLGSHFGTYVNGERIQEMSLRSGDTFIIGHHHLVPRELPASPGQTPESSKQDIRSSRFEDTEAKMKLVTVTDRTLLQASLFWGQRVLDVRTFQPGSEISLGSQKEATFGVNLTNPKYVNQVFLIARYGNGEVVLHIPAEATGLVWLGNETYSLDALRQKDKKSDQFGDLRVALRVGDRADLHFGELTLSFRFVVPAEKIPFSPLQRLDQTLLRILIILLLIYSPVLFWVSTSEVKKQEVTLKNIPKHWKKIMYHAGIENALKRQQAAIGQIATTLEGGRARSEEGQSSGKFAPEKSEISQKSNPKKQDQKSGINQNKARLNNGPNTAHSQQKTSADQSVDLDSVFNTEATGVKSQDTPMTLVGPRQDGNTIKSIATKGFARGSEGEGAGGGGKSVGIGALVGNQTGGGMGAGDYGLSPSKGHVIEINQIEELVILGGLDPDVIAAIIRRNLPQIRHCYEEQLVRYAKLKGKVTVSFVIGGTGNVKRANIIESSLGNRQTENCIRDKILTWKFPQPRGGGEVGVKYPFLLHSNTGD